MADIQYDFTANESSALQAIARLERQYDNLEGKIRNTTRSSRRGTQEATSGLERAAGAAVNLAARYVSVGAGIALIRQGYQAWIQDIEELSDRLAQNNRLLTDQLALTGDLAAGPQLQEFFQNLQGVTQRQAQDVFTAVSGAAPDLELARRQRITEAVSPLQGVLSEQNVQNIGAIAANLGQVLEGRSEEDLADLAVTVSARLGERASQAQAPGFERALRTLTEQGIDAEEALAFLTIGTDVGARGSTLAGVGGRLEAGQTLADLFAGRVELGQEQQDILDLIDPADVAALQAEFAAAQQGDIVAERRAQAAAINAPGLVRQEAQAREEDILQERARQQDELTAGQERLLSEFRNPLARGAVQAFQFAQRQAFNLGAPSDPLGLREQAIEVGTGTPVEQTAPGGESVQGLLRRIATAVEGQRLNRNAQVEGQP